MGSPPHHPRCLCSRSSLEMLWKRSFSDKAGVRERLAESLDLGTCPSVGCTPLNSHSKTFSADKINLRGMDARIPSWDLQRERRWTPAGRRWSQTGERWGVSRAVGRGDRLGGVAFVRGEDWACPEIASGRGHGI